MKVALVLSRPPGYSETFFNNKIRYLKESGMTVELFVDQHDQSFSLCPQHELPPLNILSVSISFVLTFLKNPLRVIRFIAKEINTHRRSSDIARNIYLNLHLLNSSSIDWVHFGFTTMAVGRENIASAIGAKMAVSFRGYDISRFPLRHRGIYNMLWSKIDKVHTISEALATKAKALGMPLSTKVVKITPAVDIDSFANLHHKSDFSQPLNLTTVARLHWTKGLEYTIEALALLHNKGIAFTYNIVGEGPELERLVLAAKQFGISEQIHFIGKVNHSDVKKHLELTDIYIQYSVQEGFCNATLEAQAMGLLCVVSDAEGLVENVVHGYSGWVVPRRSPDLLADKLIEIINTEKKFLNLIRQQANHRAQESFNLKKQAAEFVNFYSG